jgi:hypothetical protein
MQNTRPRTAGARTASTCTRPGRSADSACGFGVAPDDVRARVAAVGRGALDLEALELAGRHGHLPARGDRRNQNEDTHPLHLEILNLVRKNSHWNSFIFVVRCWRLNHMPSIASCLSAVACTKSRKTMASIISNGNWFWQWVGFLFLFGKKLVHFYAFFICRSHICISAAPCARTDLQGREI